MKKNINISQEQLEAIERYLNNTMKSDVKVAFEKKLEENDSFKAIFEDTKAILLGIESASLKTQLNTFHQEIENIKPLQHTKKTDAHFMLYAIAASMVVLVGLFWMFNNGTSSEQLFAKHFTPDPGLPTVMSTTDAFDFYDAMVSYKQEKYAVAIKKWEPLLVNKPKNDTLNFYLGVSYLASGDATKAERFFEEAMQATQSIFLEDAYYFSALGHLKNDNIQKAKELLEKGTTKKSEKLLKELNEL